MVELGSNTEYFYDQLAVGIRFFHFICFYLYFKI